MRQQDADQVFGLIGRLRDDRANTITAAEGAQDREGAQLSVALDTDGVLGDIEQYVEYGFPVQSAAGVGQFELARPIGHGQRARTFVHWQGRGIAGLCLALMLLDKTELDKSLADVQRGTGQCGVENGGAWRARLER
ncbi:hypothetical protein D3C76_1062520 [compost metagenome]